MLLVFSVFTHQNHHEDHMFNASICSPSLVDDQSGPENEGANLGSGPESGSKL
jgi:hypothetical protein